MNGKKRITVALIAIIIISCLFSFNIYTAEDALTENMALTMIKQALKYHKSFTEVFYEFENTTEVIEKNGLNYKPVISEYSIENLRQTMQSLYTEDLYNILMDKYSNHYLFKDGKSYYLTGAAAHILHYVYIDDIEVKILSSDADSAVAEVKLGLREYFFHNTDSNERGIIHVMFTRTASGWRISGADYRYAAFSAIGTESSATLSEDWLCDMVLATLYDLFTYTRVSAYQIRSDITYTELYPGLNKTQAWIDYAKVFCDSNIVDKILNGSTEITFSDKATRATKKEHIPDFLLEIPSRANIISNIGTSQTGGDKATVIYSVPGAGKTITYELQKKSDGWKVVGETYTDLLDDIGMLGINPDTGDHSFLIQCTLIICIASGLMIIKRKYLKTYS